MKLSRRQMLIGAGSAALAFNMPAQATVTNVLGGAAFGTSWRLTLPGGSDSAATRRAIEEIVHVIDKAMSPFRADSEITLFNSIKATDALPMSQELYPVAQAALSIAAQSKGAFDPTIGPLVRRYGFGPISNAPTGDYSAIELGEGGLRKKHPDLSLDLCGIAKGYALDRMTNALEQLGESNFLLELGGEVSARGQHISGRPWQVGIENPKQNAVPFFHIVALNEQALATSGDAVNAYEFDGVRYSHIIDPRIGKPAQNDIASVSVLAATGMQADALATTLMVMGAEQGADFAWAQNISALFVVRDGAQLREVVTGDFADQILV